MGFAHANQQYPVDGEGQLAIVTWNTGGIIGFEIDLQLRRQTMSRINSQEQCIGANQSTVKSIIAVDDNCERPGGSCLRLKRRCQFDENADLAVMIRPRHTQASCWRQPPGAVALRVTPTDIPQMTGPPGHLRGRLPAVRRPLQRLKCRDGARGQRHRSVIADRPESLLGRATNERSSPADSRRRQ